MPFNPASLGQTLAECLTQAGQVLVIESGLVHPSEAVSVRPLLPDLTSHVSPARGASPASARAAAGLVHLARQPFQETDTHGAWQETAQGGDSQDTAPCDGRRSDPLPHHLPAETVVQPASLAVWEWALRSIHGLLAPGDAPPWAAWAAWAEGLSPTPEEHWMQLFACRVSLSAQAVGLVPLPGDAFTAAQVQSMTELAAAWPATVVQAPSGTVFLKSPVAFGLVSSAPDSLAGLHLAHHLPSGPRGAEWRRLSNEMEMAFYALSEDAAGPAETPWPWGAGRLSAPCPSPEKSGPTSPPTDEAPPAIVGMRHWLAHQGYCSAIGWRKADDLTSWIDAWQEAFTHIAESAQANTPWTLIATQGSQARLWSSATRPESVQVSWRAWGRVLRQAFRLLLQPSRRMQDEQHRSTWLALASIPDLPDMADAPEDSPNNAAGLAVPETVSRTTHVDH